MSQSHRIKRNHPMSRCLTGSVASALAFEVFSCLEGDIAAKQLDNLVNRDYRAVIDQEFDFSNSRSVTDFRDSYLASELMSKFPFWDIGVDREAEAIVRFKQAEMSCAATNSFLVGRRSYVNGMISPYTPEHVIMTARRKLRRLLGHFNWDHAERYFGFGPGATSSIPNRRGDAYFKYKAPPCTTEENAILAFTAIHRIPRWYQHVVDLTSKPRDEIGCLSLSEQLREMFTFVPGNRIVTVPKNAKTDRIIAIEPTMNGFIQKGIGGLIRSKLKRVGIDLDDQRINQGFARVGSLDGSVSTIDLKSASDTVAMQLVEDLFPSDWVRAIKQARSPVGILPSGEVVTYQKVSSMGNGYTFELESSIFWALGSAVLDVFHSKDRRFSVYGDDLIFPSAVTHSYIWILNYCGFSVNTKKTFFEGAFRESCGKHYYRGTDVTPIYIRKDMKSPEHLIVFCNQVKRLARFHWGLDSKFRLAYERGVSFLPSSLRRPSVCDGFGDAALIGDFSEVLPQRLPKNDRHPFVPCGMEGFEGTVHVRVSRTRQFSDLAFLCRQLSVSSPLSVVEQLLARRRDGRWKDKPLVTVVGSGVPLPEAATVWRSVKIPIAQWVDFGPWV